jgi:hypothetical protein
MEDPTPRFEGQLERGHGEKQYGGEDNGGYSVSDISSD